MTTTAEVPLPLQQMLPDWERYLRTRGRAPRTISSYLQTAQDFIAHLEARDRPADAHQVMRRDCEEYLLDVRERSSPANQAKHYRNLQQLWRFLVDVEEELTVSPMARLERPSVPEKPVPVIPDDDIRALLKTCAGSGFDARRDTAIIRSFLDTGLRNGEMAGIKVEGAVDELHRPIGLDWRYDVFHIVGKGERARACPFGDKTGLALRRYLRVRARHPHANSDALWVGRLGPLTETGIYQMLERRCVEAKIAHIFPHQWRHTFAHVWKASGGSEEDLMRLLGWSTRQMAKRYGASAANERARDAHKRLSLGDRI